MKASLDITMIELAEEFQDLSAVRLRAGISQLILAVRCWLQNYSHLPGVRGEVRCGMENAKGMIALQAYLENYSDYLIAQERLNDEEDKVVSCDALRELVGLLD